MKAQLRRKSDCSLKVISRQPSARCKWQNSAPLAVSAVNSFISQCFNVMKCLFIIRLRTAPVGTEGRVSGKRSPAPPAKCVERFNGRFPFVLPYFLIIILVFFFSFLGAERSTAVRWSSWRGCGFLLAPCSSAHPLPTAQRCCPAPFPALGRKEHPGSSSLLGTHTLFQ